MTAHVHNQKFGGFPLVPHALPAAGNGASVFGRIGVALKAWGEKRRALSELGRLSDRELADIGLTRLDARRLFDADFVARR